MPEKTAPSTTQPPQKEVQAPVVQSEPESKPRPEDYSGQGIRVMNLSDKFRSALPKIRLTLILIPVVALFAGGTYWFLGGLKKEPEQAVVPDTRLGRIIDSGKIKIGTDATFPPMEFTDSEGNLVGYDIDLGNKIADEIGVKAEFVNIAWDDLFNQLVAKKIDMIASGVSITDERRMKYSFSESYINAGQVIMTRKNDTSIKSVADLADKKIAVQAGTTNQDEALKYTSAELVLAHDDFLLAIKSLLDGQADAILADLTLASSVVDGHQNLKIASDPFTSDYYGIVFRKDDAELVKEVNTALDVLRQRGVLVFLKQKWLE